MKNGLFITFEGPDGSGKTTVAKALKTKLDSLIQTKSLSYTNVLLTREPGGSNNKLAEEIRHILLNHEELQIPPITEAYLFAASRSAHVAQTIKPALAANEVVLCDRYLDSSIVYQGYCRQLGEDEVQQINKYAVDGIYPDLIFFFDLDTEICLTRIQSNNRENNRLDKEDVKFHQQIVEFYKQHFANKKNVVIIDANQPLENIVTVCLDRIITFNKVN